MTPPPACRPISYLAASLLLAAILPAAGLLAAPSETAPSCSSITVNEDFTNAQPGPGMCVLEDRGGDLGIDAVASPAMESHFTPAREAVPNLGYTKSAVWVKLPVTSTHKVSADFYLEIAPQFLDYVDFYYHAGPDFKVLKIGDELPFNRRKVYDRNLVFPITVEPGTGVYYLRFRTDGPLGLDITLWDIGRFQEQKSRENALLWLIYGMIAALILYNSFIFILTRDVSYLYYVIFMAAFLLWILGFSGSAFQYFWPESTHINFMAMKLSMYVVLFFIIQFARNYLATGKNFPVFDRVLLSIMCCCIAGTAFTAITRSPYSDIIVSIFILITIITLNMLGIAAIIRKIPLSRNYLIAWSPILLFGLLNILRGFGILPQNLITHYSTHIGSVIQGILFSIALTSRINLYRDERLRALEAQQVTEEKYRMLFENTAEAVFVIQGMRIILANQSGIRLLGLDSMDEITGTIRDYLHMNDYGAIERFMREYSPELIKARGWFRIVRKNGEVRWVDGSAAMIAWEGKASFLVILLDITEQKDSEERLKSSLAEKEVLLKEVHHRVKNNLQVISSLLALSQEQLSEESSRGVFSDSRSRIRTMALIHEKIYQSGDLARIDFSSYITELASTLVQSYSTPSGEVTLDIGTRGITLDIDTAIPCGLILNELITNCLKHAFPGGGGTISISFSPEATGGGVLYRLVVSDNGIGIDVPGKVDNSQTLGIQLVKNLSRQMKGTFTMENDGGTRATILFPEK